MAVCLPFCTSRDNSLCVPAAETVLAVGSRRDGGKFAVRAGETPGRFILVAGRPIGEPVARYGPFVMNTREEIHQAARDYQAGRF